MMTVAKAKIDGSITQLLQSNFDQDSKIVIITILKILDNILQQPYNGKVRKIRLQNKAFHKKVVSIHQKNRFWGLFHRFVDLKILEFLWF